MMTGRERIAALLAGQSPDHVPLMPITMMYAADLVGAHYRDYASDYRVLVEAQIATAEKFGFDYVSAISDPAREASDLGAVVEWFEDQPPAINESQALLTAKDKLGELAIPDPLTAPRMRDRVAAIGLLRARVGATHMVEGWVEGPCAEAADLRGVNTLMLDFFDDTEFVERLFQFVVDMALRFARVQVEAGADIIGIGDAAASLIGPKFYREFVAPYERKLIQGIREMGAIARLHICGNTKPILRDMHSTGADIIDLDFLAPLGAARQAMGPGQVLLGNLDPVRVVRDGTPAGMRDALRACHEEAGERWIASAGCEVPRGTPEENVLAMTEYAREHACALA